jgi:phosphatidylglycerophosphatase A
VAIRGAAGRPGLALGFAVVFFLGWWAAAVVAKASGRRDPAAIVVDEVAGQWLVLLATPRGLVAAALAFMLFRLFDIGKPWPVGWADRRIFGGFGIMLDDLMAAAYAVAAFWVLFWLLLQIGRLGGVLG